MKYGRSETSRAPISSPPLIFLTENSGEHFVQHRDKNVDELLHHVTEQLLDLEIAARVIPS